MADDLHARNLANGVALAQQAAGQGGPLADVFAELGRRYSHLLTRAGSRTELGKTGIVQPAASTVKRLAFKVIEGGAN